MTELHFEQGQALARLPENKWLSLNNQEREKVIRDRLNSDPSAMFMAALMDPEVLEESIRIKADDDSWEVALLDANTHTAVQEPIPEFASYIIEANSDDEWTIYGFVPKAEVLAWVADQGGELVPSEEWPT